MMRNISTDSSERNMEAANQDLETKLMQLQITRDKTQSIIASQNETESRDTGMR